MTWMRFDPLDEFWGRDEVAVMGFEAAGLLWFMLSRSWNNGGMKDDPEFWRRLSAGKTRRFDVLWSEVRATLTVVDGELRCDWLEAKRSETIAKLRNDADRQKQKRLSKRQNAPRPSDVTRTSVPTNEQDVQDGRTYKTNPPTPRKRGARDPFVPTWPPHLDTPAVLAAWGEWERYRVEKGHRPYTRTGFSRIVNRYASPQAFVRDVQYSIESNWQGIHPCKGGPSQAPTTPTVTASQIGTFQ